MKHPGTVVERVCDWGIKIVGLMGNGGQCPDAVNEKLLNHGPAGTGNEFYDQNEKFDEMIEDFNDYLKYHPYSKAILSHVAEKEES